MKKLILGFAVFLWSVSQAVAGEMPPGYVPPKPSPEFQRVKSLEGKWIGNMKHSTGNEEPVGSVDATGCGGKGLKPAETDGDQMREKGPSRDRTGDGGFAIRCLTTWLRGQQACSEPKHRSASVPAIFAGNCRS